MSDKIYDERPWGSYEVIERTTDYWVKSITVKPGKRLSLQYHDHREEHWVIVQGQGVCQIGEEEYLFGTGTHFHIKTKELHRIMNNGDINLVFIEVALGDKLSESDIVRVEDDYGRK